MDAGHRFVILTPLLLLLPVSKLDLLIIQVSKNNKLSRNSFIIFHIKLLQLFPLPSLVLFRTSVHFKTSHATGQSLLSLNAQFILRNVLHGVHTLILLYSVSVSYIIYFINYFCFNDALHRSWYLYRRRG